MMSKELSEKEVWLLEDLREHKYVASWDWDSDRRFIYKFYPELKEDIDALLESSALSVIRLGFHKVNFEKINKERRKLLNGLVRNGYIFAEWRGVGYGNGDYGIKRNRFFSIYIPK